MNNSRREAGAPHPLLTPKPASWSVTPCGLHGVGSPPPRLWVPLRVDVISLVSKPTLGQDSLLTGRRGGNQNGDETWLLGWHGIFAENECQTAHPLEFYPRWGYLQIEMNFNWNDVSRNRPLFLPRSLSFPSALFNFYHSHLEISGRNSTVLPWDGWTAILPTGKGVKAWSFHLISEIFANPRNNFSHLHSQEIIIHRSLLFSSATS